MKKRLRSEQEIMKNWKGNINKPLVSICCITYNHEKFIEDALKGFLIQKTDFPFEILIHDDASTDRTADIIRQYEKKYPNLIKPIYQKENQYSKGIRINPTFNFPRAKGRYLALCEGDDYWIEPNKLQIQINEMEKYPEVDMSFHPAYEVINGERGLVLAKHANRNKIFTLSEVIRGGGAFCPTASLIFRKEAVINLPEWFYKDAPVGDYFLQIFGARRGGALFINKIMSVYRRGHANSYTAMQKKDKKLKKKIEMRIVAMNKLNDFLDGKYEAEIYDSLSLSCRSALSRQDIQIEYRKKIYENYRDYFVLREKILWKFVFSKPLVYNIIKKLKDQIERIKRGVSVSKQKYIKTYNKS